MSEKKDEKAKIDVKIPDDGTGVNVNGNVAVDGTVKIEDKPPFVTDEELDKLGTVSNMFRLWDSLTRSRQPPNQNDVVLKMIELMDKIMNRVFSDRDKIQDQLWKVNEIVTEYSRLGSIFLSQINAMPNREEILSQINTMPNREEEEQEPEKKETKE